MQEHPVAPSVVLEGLSEGQVHLADVLEVGRGREGVAAGAEVSRERERESDHGGEERQRQRERKTHRRVAARFDRVLRSKALTSGLWETLSEGSSSFNSLFASFALR